MSIDDVTDGDRRDGLDIFRHIREDPELAALIDVFPRRQLTPPDDMPRQPPRSAQMPAPVAYDPSPQNARGQYAWLDVIVKKIVKGHIRLIDPADQQLLRLSQLPKDKTSGLVRVVYAHSPTGYLVHGVVLGRGVKQEQLEGVPVPNSQETFPVRGLRNFSTIYELLLDRVGVAWHRGTAMQPTDAEDFVSYAVEGPKSQTPQKYFEMVLAATQILQQRLITAKPQ